MNQPGGGALIADLLAPFAEAASIRLHDAGGTLRKRILVSLHFADAERVHDTLFPGDHLDWLSVRVYLASDASTNISTHEWVRLIGLLRFIAEPPARPQFNDLLAAVGTGARVSMQGRDLNPVESLQLCFARAGAAAAAKPPSWDLLCKTLLLVNITDIDAPAALHTLFAGQAAWSVEAFLKHLPSACRHSREDYSRTFAQLLGDDGCHVASHLILQSIRCREEAQEQARQSHAAALRGSEKPSLTRILQARIEAAGASSYTAAAGGEGLRLFCHRARLPGNLNYHLRLACYYIGILRGGNGLELCTRLQALRRLAGDADAVFLDVPALTAMLGPDLPAHHIDATAVRAFILAHMQHVGSPCAALQQFRTQCMPSGGALTWTIVLRFYLAAYCPPPLNKDVWDRIVKQVLSTSSTTHESNNTSAIGAALLRREGDAVVQAFVRSNPPALYDLVDLILVHGACASAPPSA